MIEIKRDGTKVVLWFALYVPTWEERRFPLSFDCGNEAYAGLLCAAMRIALGERLTAIRQESYNAGWSDKSAKRTKASWFSSLWSPK